MKNRQTRNKILMLAPLAFFLFLGANAQAAAYDFFVDKSSAQETEDGSEQYPWKTITGATNFIESGNLKNKTIFVKEGTYPESVALSRNVKLVGESKSGTIIDADGYNNAINFSSTKSQIKNMTIKNSEATAVIIDKRSKATIDNCNIEKAGKYGIEVKESTAAEKYKFTIKNSSVSDNGSQGLYISRRKISITDNEIFSNKGEGVDLHQGVKGKVSGNHIHGNTESGIESILSGANFIISGNNVENNHAQGITVQVYSVNSKGKIKIKRNTFKGNSDYGIRYANYTHKIGPKKFKVFVDKYVKKSKNTIRDNGEGDLYYQ
ncbi:MAG: pectinesterase family protein [Candidatus Moranbacteria bacterium]|nr:pectinesterase family protein [Candidatus Moranbacteria bacterium]